MPSDVTLDTRFFFGVNMRQLAHQILLVYCNLLYCHVRNADVAELSLVHCLFGVDLFNRSLNGYSFVHFYVCAKKLSRPAGAFDSRGIVQRDVCAIITH